MRSYLVCGYPADVQGYKNWRYSRDRRQSVSNISDDRPAAIFRIDVLRYQSTGTVSVERSLAEIQRVANGSNWKTSITMPLTKGEYAVFGQIIPVGSLLDPTKMNFSIGNDFIFCRDLVVTDQ